MSSILRQRTVGGQISDKQTEYVHQTINDQETSVQSNTPTNPQSNHDLLIIGAGLMRTGTTSLKVALEQLYEKPCYHMSRTVLQFKQSHIKLWIELYERTQDSNNFSQTDFRNYFDRLFEGFQMTVDYPACTFYRELIQLYPNSKVVLTIRDPDQWVESVLATMGSKSMRRNPTPGERLIYAYHGIKDLYKLHSLMFTRTLGSNFAVMTPDQLKQSYIRWNEQVLANVPSDRLLVFNCTQGWLPLCRFVQLPVPGPEIVYPHLNKRADMVDKLNRFLVPGRILDCFLVCMLVVFLSMILFYR